ncbi:MAG: type II toxin-antitoxin system VapC family toxin [Propionibacteriaceae bacterium]|jgi:predicted nucleic acid-binding protein|nr:type II toxin-antitoxin system VapC family toxin [Propionibacteriaceae bacterium]
MIGYFDTSAVIPLVIAEPSTEMCARLWLECDVRVSTLLIIAEAGAALAQALRMGRLDDAQYEKAVELLGRRAEELDLISVTRKTVDDAAKLAARHALRGYDAVHVASALAVSEEDLVGISGDKQLLDVLRSEGVDVVNVNDEERNSDKVQS